MDICTPQKRPQRQCWQIWPPRTTKKSQQKRLGSLPQAPKERSLPYSTSQKNLKTGLDTETEWKRRKIHQNPSHKDRHDVPKVSISLRTSSNQNTALHFFPRLESKWRAYMRAQSIPCADMYAHTHTHTRTRTHTHTRTHTRTRTHTHTQTTTLTRTHERVKDVKARARTCWQALAC